MTTKQKRRPCEGRRGTVNTGNVDGALVARFAGKLNPAAITNNYDGGYGSIEQCAR